MPHERGTEPGPQHLCLARDRPAWRQDMRMGISLGGLILLILIIWLLFFRG
jgi:hypothetical protein